MASWCEDSYNMPDVNEPNPSELAALALGHGRPLCMLSSGETTVHVTGAGRGIGAAR